MTPPRLHLSVLDQSTAAQGREQGAAIRETLALARHCEALGYRRFWVSEHHNSDSIVGTAPEILIAAIAATTSRIRVGAAGIMLPHYAALKVAEQFRVLEAIAPGRIDLGLGRAPGSDRLTAYALNPLANAADGFPQQVRDLLCWVCGTPLPEGHPFHAIRAHPQGPTQPEVWILGSSDYGAQLAAHFGLPYAYAYFFSDGRGAAEALTLYRRLYRPSARQPTPRATICVWALAADSEAEARHLLHTREHWRVGFEQGKRHALLPPEDAATQRLAPHEQEIVDRLRAKAIVGTGPQVRQRLREIAAELDLDEMAIVTWTYAPEHRHRSYEIIAREFELAAP